MKEFVKDKPLQELEDPTNKETKIETADKRDGGGQQACRKHMGLAKCNEQRQRIQDKSRKARKFVRGFLTGNHFRKAPALVSKPKVVKRRLNPLKKLCPRVKGLLRRLGSRWASRDNQ